MKASLPSYSLTLLLRNMASYHLCNHVHIAQEI